MEASNSYARRRSADFRRLKRRNLSRRIAIRDSEISDSSSKLNFYDEFSHSALENPADSTRLAAASSDQPDGSDESGDVNSNPKTRPENSDESTPTRRRSITENSNYANQANSNPPSEAIFTAPSSEISHSPPSSSEESSWPSSIEGARQQKEVLGSWRPQESNRDDDNSSIQMASHSDFEPDSDTSVNGDESINQANSTKQSQTDFHMNPVELLLKRIGLNGLRSRMDQSNGNLSDESRRTIEQNGRMVEALGGQQTNLAADMAARDFEANGGSQTKQLDYKSNELDDQSEDDVSLEWQASQYIYMHMKAISSVFGMEVDVEWSNERSNLSASMFRSNNSDDNSSIELAQASSSSPPISSGFIDLFEASQSLGAAPFATIDVVYGQTLELECVGEYRNESD